MIPIGVLLFNPLVRRFGPYVLLGVIALWGLRVWNNRIAERAAAEARIRQVESQLKSERQGWEEREKTFLSQREALDKGFTELNRERERLGQTRISIRGQLDQSLESLKTELGKRQDEVVRLPGSVLDDEIRKQLAVLR